jgi:hypothetical protein
MKLKKEYVILFLIIIALVLYLVLRKQDQIQYKLPDINEIPRSEILKIEIRGKDGPIVIKKSNTMWAIGPEEYPADEKKIEKILGFIEKPVLVTMVSDSKSYTRYGLDKESRIMVTVYSGDSVVRSLDIGYSVSGHDYTFIKLENDHRVYHARGKIRNLLETDMDGLRDKTVLSFDQDKINSITINKGDNIYTMVLEAASPEQADEDKKSEKPETSWKDAQGNDMDNMIPGQLFSTLANLLCEEYIYDYKKKDLDKPIFSITLKGEKEYSLSIYAKKEEDEDYPAVSSENPYPFILSGWKAEKLMKIMGKNENPE